MTREEAQARISTLVAGTADDCTRNHYRDVAKGVDEIYDDFESTTCKKCGHSEADWKYIPEGTRCPSPAGEFTQVYDKDIGPAVWGLPYECRTEHLRLTCQRCGYVWHRDTVANGGVKK